MSSEGSKTGKGARRRQKKFQGRGMRVQFGGPGLPHDQHLRIDTLPDDVLLKIFTISRVDDEDGYGDRVWDSEWLTLAHVCRRWRQLLFESPHHLDLRLVCTPKRPVRTMLNIWPCLPIVIRVTESSVGGTIAGEIARGSMCSDQIIAALRHKDRVCRITLYYLTSYQLKGYTAVMMNPFPQLTYLSLHSNGGTGDLPDGFLGASAPRLQTLRLFGIPFPALPKLLQTTLNLRELRLINMPYTMYIPSESIITSLSGLTRLESLRIECYSTRSHPDPSAHLPPSTRMVLPVLADLYLLCPHDYVESFVSRLDAPLITTVNIWFLGDFIFSFPQLAQFISHGENLKVLNNARVDLFSYNSVLTLSTLGGPSDSGSLIFGIQCRESPQQLSFISTLGGQVLPALTSVSRLEITESQWARPNWRINLNHTRWLAFFRPFITVEALHLSKELSTLIAPALGALTGQRATEVLPALRDLFIVEAEPSGHVRASLEPFIAARRLSRCQVDVHHGEMV